MRLTADRSLLLCARALKCVRIYLRPQESGPRHLTAAARGFLSEKIVHLHRTRDVGSSFSFLITAEYNDCTHMLSAHGAPQRLRYLSCFPLHVTRWRGKHHVMAQSPNSVVMSHDASDSDPRVYTCDLFCGIHATLRVTT